MSLFWNNGEAVVKNKHVKHAGVSVVTDENGRTSVHYHVTNSWPQHAVVKIELPTEENKPVIVQAIFLKCPENTSRLAGLTVLLEDLKKRAGVSQTLLTGLENIRAARAKKETVAVTEHAVAKHARR